MGAIWLAAAILAGCTGWRAAVAPKARLAKEPEKPQAAAAKPAMQPATRPAAAPMTRQEALKFLDAHGRLDSFQGWKEPDRRQAIAKALGIAEQFRRTDIAARALMTAAAAYAGQCERTRPLGKDGWDRAIALYRRVGNEHPRTKYAQEARWLIAGCHGCWRRWGCCRFNQGKEDWAGAIRLYRDLYDTAADAGTRCDALRRIAEIQCNCLGLWPEGLATYRRIVRELPKPPAPSPFSTNRTCGPLNGTHLIDFDIVEFTHQRLLEKIDDPPQAIRLRDQFDKLAPQRDTIRFHTLYQLEQRLRRLGATAEADEIKAKLGLCEVWVVVGPFNGDGSSGGSPGGEVAEIPPDLVGLRRLVRVWRRLPEAMCWQIRTPYAPEKDILAGKIDLARMYRLRARDGRRGSAMWIRPTSPLLHKTWTADGALYAMAYVHCPKAQPGRLRMAISGFARAWLNGRSVLATDVLDYPVMDQHVGAVQLKAGRNQLVVKLVPWDKTFRSYLRITDKTGWSLPGIRYSAPQVPPGNWAGCDFLRKPAEPRARHKPATGPAKASL